MYTVISGDYRFDVALPREATNPAMLEYYRFSETWGGYHLVRTFGDSKAIQDVLGYKGGQNDDALPQPWVNEYRLLHGEDPDAIWSYQDGKDGEEGKLSNWDWETYAFNGELKPVSRLGTPISWRQILEEFGRWAAGEITNGEAEWHDHVPLAERMVAKKNPA